MAVSNAEMMQIHAPEFYDVLLKIGDLLYTHNTTVTLIDKIVFRWHSQKKRGNVRSKL